MWIVPWLLKLGALVLLARTFVRAPGWRADEAAYGARRPLSWTECLVLALAVLFVMAIFLPSCEQLV